MDFSSPAVPLTEIRQVSIFFHLPLGFTLLCYLTLSKICFESITSKKKKKKKLVVLFSLHEIS